MKIAFQGVHGAYSEAAARKTFGGRCSTVPCETFEEVFSAVEDGRADRAVIPIENSLAGSIHGNYDLLLSHHLYIVGETYLRIEHLLMCHPASSLRRLRYVRSHPQALAQCSRFFSRTPKLKPVAYFDTAGAAKSLIGESALDSGAIASELAARIYGLKILKRDLEDRPSNYTRFLIIGGRPWRPKPGVHAKTSIAFIPARNEVGILFSILGAFSLRGIDLLKIESRPDPQSPFEYLFYLDLVGSPHEKSVAGAFEHLQEMVSTFRLLGTYPAGRMRLKGKRRTPHRK